MVPSLPYISMRLVYKVSAIFRCRRLSCHCSLSHKADETAKELWMHLKDNGSLDIADQTPEIERLERLLLQRDVEWM